MSAPLLEEIKLEILSRLPFSSRQRFKSVCKQWLKLISEELDPSIILVQYQNARNILGRNTTSMGYVEIQNHNMVAFPNLSFSSRHRILAACNGLMLMGDAFSHQLEIANPLTKQVSRITSPAYADEFYQAYGWGFVPSTKEMKLVHIFKLRPLPFQPLATGDDDKIIRCRILTVPQGHLTNTPCWRLLEPAIPAKFVSPFAHGSSRRKAATWVCGRLFWPNFKGGLLVMELKRETFSRVPLPSDEIKEDHYYLLELGQGRISCMAPTPVANYGVWVMEGVRGNWVELYRVCSPLPCLMMDGKVLVEVQPIGSLNNGRQIVFQVELTCNSVCLFYVELVVYDTRLKKFVKIVKEDANVLYHCAAVNVINSILW